MAEVIGVRFRLCVCMLLIFQWAQCMEYEPLRKNYKQELLKQATDQNRLGRRLVQAYSKLYVAHQNGVVVVSGECLAQIGVWLEALGESTGSDWAARMLDAWGTRDPGFLEGDSVWEGSWPECSRVNDVTTGVRGRHCLTNWYGVMLEDGFGTCLPATCSESDVKLFLIDSVDDLEDVMPPLWRILGMNSSWVHCAVSTGEKGITQDASAMAAIAVLSLFVLMGILGTIYDLATMRRREPPQNADDKTPPSQVRAYQIPRPSFSGSLPRNRRLNGSPPGSGTHINHVFDYTSGALDPKSVPQGFVSYPPDDYVNSNNSNNSRWEEPLAAVQTPEIQRNPWQPDTCGKFLLAFSIRQHVPRILSFDHPKGSIKCLNGIRFLAFAWIVVGHSWVLGLLATSTPTVANKLTLLDKGRRATHMMVKNHIFPVESFFVLSGLLTAVSFLKKLQRKKPDCEMMGLYIFHRYWRLTPVYMLVLMAYGCLFHYLASGPLYPGPEDYTDASNCKQNFWKNLIYVNNLIDIRRENTCMDWSWYLANDFQFYIISPVFLFALFYVPVFGIVLTVLACCGGLTADFYLNHQLLNERNPDGSATIDAIYDIYIKPWTRCTTYFMGLLLGYLLWKLDFKVKMNKGGVAVGWILTMALVSTLTFVEFDSICDWCTPWTNAGVVAFEGFKEAGMGLVNCWIIFACATGYGGFINSILSWNGWLPLARLSYAGYLFHPILIYFYFYQRPVQYYINDMDQAFLAVGFVFLSLGASFLISLFLEVPFGALEKLMFANTPGNKKNPEVTKLPSP